MDLKYLEDGFDLLILITSNWSNWSNCIYVIIIVQVILGRFSKWRTSLTTELLP